MPICDLCTASISSKSPGLKCCGSCNKFYHGKCVNLSKQDVSRFLQPDAYWYCTTCRIKAGPKRQSIIACDDDSESSDSPIFTLSILKDIQANIKSLNNKYEAVLESVNFCSNQITTFELTIKKLNDKIAAIEKLSKENVELKLEINNLNVRVETLEQQSRLNNVEIQGVPEKSNENLYTIIEKIGEHIQCPMSTSIIDTVYRVSRHPSSEKPKSIIVKFLSKQKRDEILAAAKAKRLTSSNNSPGLIIEGISHGLFVNEHLTNKNKLILIKAKEMAKKSSYKYIWARNGHIFARKNDRSKVFKILSESDIDKLT